MMDSGMWPFGEGSEFEESLAKFARLLRMVYQTLVDEGFTEAQALSLVRDVLNNALSGGVKGGGKETA